MRKTLLILDLVRAPIPTAHAPDAESLLTHLAPSKTLHVQKLFRVLVALFRDFASVLGLAGPGIAPFSLILDSNSQTRTSRNFFA